MLEFLGRGAAFTDDQNSAFFVDKKDIILLDCPMSSFHKIRKMGPDGLIHAYNSKYRANQFSDDTPKSSISEGSEGVKFYVIVTHTHGDHVSGIAMLIHFCYYVWKLPVYVITPSDEVKQDLIYLLKRLEGCADDAYSIIMAEELDKWGLEAISTTHSPELAGRCFGYKLMIHGKDVIFSGDTCTLKPYEAYLNNTKDAEFYVEMAYNKSPVHLCISERLEFLKGLTENGIKVYIMHMDNEEKIGEAIEGSGIEFAPLI